MTSNWYTFKANISAGGELSLPSWVGDGKPFSLSDAWVWDEEGEVWVDSGYLELEAAGGGRYLENFIVFGSLGEIYFGGL